MLLPSGSNLRMKVKNCKISIFDDHNLRAAVLAKNHLDNVNPSTDNMNNYHLDNNVEDGINKDNGGMILNYNIPGRFNLDFFEQKHSSIMEEEIKGQNYNFKFENILSPESC